MRKSFAASKSRSEALAPVWKSRAARDFFVALLLLSLALVSALAAEKATEEGAMVTGILLALFSLLLAGLVAVTVVPRLARRVDLTRWLLPFHFSITKEGGFYILSVFLLSLAAINTGNNLLFLILSALLSAMITSGIVARASLRSVSVSMQVPENVYVGEHVGIKVSLKNRKKLFPTFSIYVTDRNEERKPSLLARILSGALRQPGQAPGHPVLLRPAYFPVLRAGEVRSELVSQTFPRRGEYRFEGFRVSTRFPFGFFQRGEEIKAEGVVLVYPSIASVSPYFHLLPFLPGVLEGKHLGQGESLYSIRKYQEGESARLLDWKATAKTGELMAREYAREEMSRFCLILDTLIHQGPWSEYTGRFEKAVSLAAGLTAHFLREEAELEFITPDEHIPGGGGEEHLYRILRSLAKVECRPAGEEASGDLRGELSAILPPPALRRILSEKTFKIIVTSKPRGSFPATVWRSSHVVYFDEL